MHGAELSTTGQIYVHIMVGIGIIPTFEVRDFLTRERFFLPWQRFLAYTICLALPYVVTCK